MVGDASLRWILTVAFGAAAIFHLVRCLRPRDAGRPLADAHRTSEVLHLIMCVSMIVMVWPWGSLVPAVVWLGVFTLSTGWFITRAAWSAGRRAAPAFFATAAAAMVWMGAVPAHASATGAHHLTTAGGGAASSGYPGWISAGLGGYLMLAAVWWVIRGMRLGGLSAAPAALTAPNWSALCHGVMSAGMALALLAMA